MAARHGRDNYTHGAMAYAFVLDNFDALREERRPGRPHLLPGGGVRLNEAARATV